MITIQTYRQRDPLPVAWAVEYDSREYGLAPRSELPGALT
jgi:hypothetical protein